MSWESFDIFWHHWTSLRDNFGAFSNVFSRFWHETAPWFPRQFPRWPGSSLQHRWGCGFVGWMMWTNKYMGYVLLMFYVFLCDNLWISMINMMELSIYSIHIDMGIVWIWNCIMCTEQRSTGRVPFWRPRTMSLSALRRTVRWLSSPCWIYFLWNMYEYLSIYLSVCLSICLSIYLSIYIYICTVYYIYNVGSWLV